MTYWTLLAGCIGLSVGVFLGPLLPGQYYIHLIRCQMRWSARRAKRVVYRRLKRQKKSRAPESSEEKRGNSAPKLKRTRRLPRHQIPAPVPVPAPQLVSAPSSSLDPRGHGSQSQFPEPPPATQTETPNLCPYPYDFGESPSRPTRTRPTVVPDGVASDAATVPLPTSGNNLETKGVQEEGKSECRSSNVPDGHRPLPAEAALALRSLLPLPAEAELALRSLPPPMNRAISGMGNVNVWTSYEPGSEKSTVSSSSSSSFSLPSCPVSVPPPSCPRLHPSDSAAVLPAEPPNHVLSEKLGQYLQDRRAEDLTALDWYAKQESSELWRPELQRCSTASLPPSRSQIPPLHPDTQALVTGVVESVLCADDDAYPTPHVLEESSADGRPSGERGTSGGQEREEVSAETHESDEAVGSLGSSGESGNGSEGGGESDVPLTRFLTGVTESIEESGAPENVETPEVQSL